MFEQSSLGVIYTRRATGDDGSGTGLPDRHTVGVDLDLYTSRFLGDKNLQLEAFFVGHTDPEAGGTSTFDDLTARGIRINFPNDVWRVHTSYRELGDEFKPALGFTRRNGFRRLQPTVSFSPRPGRLLGIRQFQFEVQFEYLMNMDWERETQKTDFKVLGLRFHSGDRLDVDVTHLRELLDEDFEIQDGITIPVGDYETWEGRASLRTASRRIVSGSAEIGRSEFWSGNRTTYELSATVRPMSGFSLSTRYELNDVSLPQGDFSTQLVRVEGNWQFSPWIAFASNLQYDTVSDVVGLFGRLRWIIRPGSDLYLVFTHNWESVYDSVLDRSRLNTLSRGATTKLNYTYRF
jgi:hypothetical protein